MNSDQYRRVVGVLHAYWSAQPDVQTITEAFLGELGEMLRQDVLADRVVLADDGVWLPPQNGRPACRISVQVGGIAIHGVAGNALEKLLSHTERILDQTIPEWRVWAMGASESGPRALENEEDARLAIPDDDARDDDDCDRGDGDR